MTTNKEEAISLIPNRTIEGILISSDADAKSRLTGEDRKMFTIGVELARGPVIGQQGRTQIVSHTLSVRVFENSSGDSFETLKAAEVGSRVKILATERSAQGRLQLGGTRQDGKPFETLLWIATYNALPGGKVTKLPAK